MAADPATVLDVWREVSGYPHAPEACLVNYYAPDAKMGLHQDRDEEDFSAPVVSISLGDDCLFRVGGRGARRSDASLKLSSGDVVVLGGASAPRLPRRRPHLSRHLDAARRLVPRRRPHQPDAPAGDTAA